MKKFILLLVFLALPLFAQTRLMHLDFSREDLMTLQNNHYVTVLNDITGQVVWNQTDTTKAPKIARNNSYTGRTGLYFDNTDYMVIDTVQNLPSTNLTFFVVVDLRIENTTSDYACILGGDAGAGISVLGWDDATKGLRVISTNSGAYFMPYQMVDEKRAQLDETIFKIEAKTDGTYDSIWFNNSRFQATYDGSNSMGVFRLATLGSWQGSQVSQRTFGGFMYEIQIWSGTLSYVMKDSIYKALAMKWGVPLINNDIIRAYHDDASQSIQSGTGTANDPYLIYDQGDLDSIRIKGLDKYYKLMADIRMDTTNWVPLGKTSAAPFTGHIDGNNHKITNLHIHRMEATTTELGFIGAISTLQDPNLELIKDITFDSLIIDIELGGKTSYSQGFIMSAAYGDAQSVSIKGVHIVNSSLKNRFHNYGASAIGTYGLIGKLTNSNWINAVGKITYSSLQNCRLNGKQPNIYDGNVNTILQHTFADVTLYASSWNDFVAKGNAEKFAGSENSYNNYVLFDARPFYNQISTGCNIYPYTVKEGMAGFIDSSYSMYRAKDYLMHYIGLLTGSGNSPREYIAGFTQVGNTNKIRASYWIHYPTDRDIYWKFSSSPEGTLIPHEILDSNKTKQAFYDSLNFSSTWRINPLVNEGMPYLGSNPPTEYYDVVGEGDSDGSAENVGYPSFNFFFIKGQ